MGKKQRQQQIREMLTNAPDGLRASDIAKQIDIPGTNVHNTVGCMPDVFQDRWELNDEGTHWVHVFCLWTKPEPPPRPSITPNEYRKRVAA